MTEEHTLPSGETIVITNNGKRPNKPWEVMCIAIDGEEIRWVVEFATEEEARKEYVRFD